MFGCRHRWRESRRYFNPPLVRSIEADHMPRDLFREVMEGVTTVELRCEKCGDLASRRVPGNATQRVA